MTHPLNGNLHAISTSYGGCLFRSRLEARWAVFFDELGLPWEYEPQGYVLPNGDWYLPDFWLPSLQTWYEVKGPQPIDQERERTAQLGLVTFQRALLAWGGVPNTGEDAIAYGGYRDVELVYRVGVGGGDVCYAWCVCPVCGRVGIEYCGRGARVCPEGTHSELVWHYDGRSGYDDKSYTYDDPRIRGGYAAARSARFGR